MMHVSLSLSLRPSHLLLSYAGKAAAMHDFCLGYPYGALLIAGGLAGFVLAGSTASLIAGSTSGALMLVASQLSLSAYTRGSRSTISTVLGLITSAAVTMHMSKRYPPLMLFQRPKLVLGITFVVCRYVITCTRGITSTTTKSTHASRSVCLSLSLSLSLSLEMRIDELMTLNND